MQAEGNADNKNFYYTNLGNFKENPMSIFRRRSFSDRQTARLNSTISKTSVLYFTVCVRNTRAIQKISFVCEYYRCSAAVTMVRMRAEFVDSVARHGRNLQIFEQCLRIALWVYNIYKQGFLNVSLFSVKCPSLSPA